MVLFEYHQPDHIGRIIGSDDTLDQIVYQSSFIFCKLVPDQIIRPDNHVGHMVYSISEYQMIDLLWIQYIRYSNSRLIVPLVDPI